MSDKKSNLNIIIPMSMISALIKTFVNNLQTRGRRIRQELLIEPAYLTNNKDAKRRTIAMTKAKDSVKEDEKKIDIIAREAANALSDRNIDLTDDMNVPENVYPDIIRRLNNTGFFDFLLTEEGLNKRGKLREIAEERKRERIQATKDEILRKERKNQRNVFENKRDRAVEISGSDFASANDASSSMDLDLSDGTSTLRDVRAQIDEYIQPTPKPIKPAPKKKKKKQLPKPQPLPPPLPKRKPKPKLKPITPPTSSDSGSATVVAPVSGDDTRSVAEIMAERDRMSVVSSGDSSSQESDVETLNMNVNRLKFEKNIDYITRLKKIQRRMLTNPNINIGDTIQINAIITKTKKQIARNKMTQKKRDDDLQVKRDMLEDQKQELARMEQEAKMDRFTISEQARMRTEQIAEEATRQREQIREDVRSLIANTPKLRKIAIDIIGKLKEKSEYEDMNIRESKKKYPIKKISNISARELKSLITTIPEDYRATLGPVVRNLVAGGDMDANTIVAGIIGIGLSIGTGSAVAGPVGANIFNSIREATGFNFNNMFQPELPAPSSLSVYGLESKEDTDQPRESKHNEILDMTFEPDFEVDFSKIPYSDAKELPDNEEKKGFNILLGDVSSQLREMLPNVPDKTIIDKAMNYIMSKTPTQLKTLIALALVVPSGTLRAIERKLSGPFKSSIKYFTGMDDEDARIVILNTGIIRNALMSDVRRIGDSAVRRISTRIPAVRNVPPLIAPRRSDIDLGVGLGSTATSIASGLSTGSAMGALSGSIPGMIGGAIAGGVSGSVLRTYFRSQGVPDSPELERKIDYLQMLPVAAVGAYLGYTPSGQPDDVIGKGVVSGAGITEKKINVDPKVLAETQAQLDQKIPKNKQWLPKAIQPTTAILDQSQQERYADDLEFVAFNYIAPTSEGAQGNINTNPLKRQQYVGNEIRYDNAGVFIPYDTWNQINNTNDISEQRIREMALGQKPLVPLPDMRFIPQNNETTFENMAEYHYVNNENTAIEYQSPYSDYSDVRNYWAINEESELFTINP